MAFRHHARRHVGGSLCSGEGFRKAIERREAPSEIRHRGRHVGMLIAVQPLVHAECLGDERFGIGSSAQLKAHGREIVQAQGHVVVITWEEATAHLQGLQLESFGFSRATEGPANCREVVQAGGKVGMVAADALAIVVGRQLGARLPERAVKIGAAVLFFVFGLVLFVEAW